MRSQLSFNRRVVYSLAILLLIGQSVSVAAEKFTLSGEVIWPDEDKKKKPKIILKGEKSYDALISSCKKRFRPIIMTGLSTVVGIIPLVIGSGAGYESRLTIGLVLISGIIFSK